VGEIERGGLDEFSLEADRLEENDELEVVDDVIAFTR
jgi:hypothetical protein